MGSRRRHEPAPMNPAVVGACPEEWHGLITKFLDACVPRLTRIPVDPDALTKTKSALARALRRAAAARRQQAEPLGVPLLSELDRPRQTGEESGARGPPQSDRRGPRPAEPQKQALRRGFRDP